MTPDVRLWHRAVVVHQENSLRGLVRQLSIDQLDNEGRRVGVYEGKGDKSPLFARSFTAPGVDKGTHKRVINELLRPRTWKAPDDRQFFLTAQDIGELCDNAERIFREERTVLDLHGTGSSRGRGAWCMRQQSDVGPYYLCCGRGRQGVSCMLRGGAQGLR